VPRLSFFIGKGGVGKTTLAAAHGVRSALRHKRTPVLLISTDPAHSLADVFQLRLGNSPKQVPLPAAGRLFAWQIDAQTQFDKFISKYRKPMLDLVERGTMFTREEIEPLLDTTVPGMAELAALLVMHDLLKSGRYDEIVVDTAPVGHTLRLFQMPEHFARFLNFLEVAGSRDRILAERFGGVEVAENPAVAEWRQMVGDILQALSGENSQLILVTTPEKFALNQSVRAARALKESSMQLRISAVVLNRAVVRAESCGACRNRARATRSALAFLRRDFPRLPVYFGEDHGSPLLGTDALAAFAEHVFDRKKLRLKAPPPRSQHEATFEHTPWPALETPLSLTIGKGGVGKTTVSAALAFHQRARGRSRAVTVCSTDPAPSLDDIFQKPIGDAAIAVLDDAKLRAVELDSVAEFRRWSAEIKQKLDQALSSEHGGLHVDLSLDREVITALLDVVPPGVDEIFAIFRILDLLAAPRQLLVIDMAPTAHALEVLRMPARMLQWSRLLLKSLAPHRTLPLAQDVAVEVAAVGQRVRELLRMLRDGSRSRVWTVMLAEPMPDRETGRLLEQLQDLGIPPAPLFVNRVIFPGDAGQCARCWRASAWQMATLAQLGRRIRGREIYLVRDYGHEIAGAGGLREITSELWRLVQRREARRAASARKRGGARRRRGSAQN
jgi:arsenite-transporting ATPase